jgi:hypothetical protein
LLHFCIGELKVGVGWVVGWWDPMKGNFGGEHHTKKNLNFAIVTTGQHYGTSGLLRVIFAPSKGWAAVKSQSHSSDQVQAPCALLVPFNISSIKCT